MVCLRIYRHFAPLEQGGTLYFLPSDRTYLWSETGSSARTTTGTVFSAVRQNLSVE